MITIPVTQIVSRNCGGCGAWLDNPLGSPSPSADIWPGFQLGGGRGGKRKINKSKKRNKLRKSSKIMKSKKSRMLKKLKDRRNIQNRRTSKKL